MKNDEQVVEFTKSLQSALENMLRTFVQNNQTSLKPKALTQTKAAITRGTSILPKRAELIYFSL